MPGTWVHSWLCPLLPEEYLAPRWHVISVVKLLIGVTVAAFLCDEHRGLSDLFWKLTAVVFLRGGAHSHSLPVPLCRCWPPGACDLGPLVQLLC